MEELLARITSRELTEWAAWEQEYGPLGPERGDWQAAIVAQTVAASQGAKGTRLSDFLPAWGGRKQTGQEQLALFKGLASQGGSPDGNDR